MRLTEWNEKKVKWDAYSRHHMGLHGEWHSPLFVQFDDQSMMLRPVKMKPDFRRHYKDIGIQIIAGHDSGVPKLMTADGDKVPKSWVKDQILVIDHDTGVVVSPRRDRRKEVSEDLPEYAKNSLVYWPFPGARPQGGKIRLNRPKELAKDERAHVSTIIAACKAWWTFAGKAEFEANKIYSWHYSYHLRHSDLLNTSFDKLEPKQRACVATNGVSSDTERVILGYLRLALP